jgi:hypothetical protein
MSKRKINHLKKLVAFVMMAGVLVEGVVATFA